MREFAPEQAADAGDVGAHEGADADGVDDVEGHRAADVDQAQGGGEEEGEDYAVDWELEAGMDL